MRMRNKMGVDWFALGILLVEGENWSFICVNFYLSRKFRE